MEMKPLRLKGLIIYVLITIGLGVVGALLAGDIGAVYAGLVKPPMAPPGVVFPIVWNILYALMGVSVYLLSLEKAPVVFELIKNYFFQLILNVLWQIVFWRVKAFYVAAALIVFLLVLGIRWAIRVFRLNAVSSLLFWPYLLWLCFALYLNIGIAILN